MICETALKVGAIAGLVLAALAVQKLLEQIAVFGVLRQVRPV